MKPRGAYGYGALLVGALTIAVATFLPFQKSDVYEHIDDNNLIHSVSGIVLLCLGAGILFTGYRTAQGYPGKLWQPTMMNVGALVLILWIAADKERRTLYPITASGMVDTRQPAAVSSLSIAIYVAAAGAAVSFIGCLMMVKAIDDVEICDDEDDDENEEDDR